MTKFSNFPGSIYKHWQYFFILATHNLKMELKVPLAIALGVWLLGKVLQLGPSRFLSLSELGILESELFPALLSLVPSPEGLNSCSDNSTNTVLIDIANSLHVDQYIFPIYKWLFHSFQGRSLVYLPLPGKAIRLSPFNFTPPPPSTSK